MPTLQQLVAPDDPMLRALRLGNHQFPGIWNHMMPREFLGLKLPDERRATCMNCPKSCYEDYRPDYRCCTYHPKVPSFLLGLASLTPSGEKVIQKLIDTSALLPEGMHHAPAQWVDYLDDLEHESFGKSQKVLCPNLEVETGYCMIHAFRNSVCSTFYCYKDHGDLGDAFWGHVQTLGSQLEMALGQWSLEAVGFDLLGYFKTFDRLARRMQDVSRPDGGWQKEALEQLWGSWAGRELELMRACASVIVEQKDNLWDIANSYQIKESKAFDKAMVKSVPKRLKDQVDPEDLDEEDAEAARPRELWLQLLKSYHKLWDLPEGYYHLNPRVVLSVNEQADASEKYYAANPFCLSFFTRKDGKTLDWRQFLTAPQKELLDLFRDEAHQLDWRFLMRDEIKKVPQLKEFLTEMLAQKVLIKRVYH